MTPSMRRTLDELGEECLQRKPELADEWKTLQLIGTTPNYCNFLDKNFPILGGWGIQPISQSPNVLRRYYP